MNKSKMWVFRIIHAPVMWSNMCLWYTFRYYFLFRWDFIGKIQYCSQYYHCCTILDKMNLMPLERNIIKQLVNIVFLWQLLCTLCMYHNVYSIRSPHSVYTSPVLRNIEFESRHYMRTYVQVGRIETDIHTKYCWKVKITFI